MNTPANIHISEIAAQVFAFLDELGISQEDGGTLHIDGRLHRFRVHGDKPGTENGFYRIYADEWPAGYVGSWKHTGEPVKWRFNLKDRQDFKATQEYYRKYYNSNGYKEMMQAREKELAEAQSRARDEARARFDQYKAAAPNHPYLKRKNVESYGLKQIGEALVVPLYDVDENFRTYQTIAPDGEKLFYPGAPTKGAFFSVATLGPANAKIDGPILICEGYATGATMYEVTGYPVVCAMNAGNLLPVAKALRERFPDRKILVAADNDTKTKGNPGLTKAQEAVEQAKLDGLIFPEFPDGVGGTDFNDYTRALGPGPAKTAISTKIEAALSRPVLTTAQNKKREELRAKLKGKVAAVNAADLLRVKFPDVRWAIDGFLPAGCSILSGGPKVGKSILALHLALAVSIGGTALGSISVECGDVLYLALEDTKRRLQSRIFESGISEDIDLSRLTLVTSIPKQHEGGAFWIDDWLYEHRDARLVIIDTLQKFRKPHNDKGDRYASDYEAISAIKSAADRYNVATLIIHHTKKAKDEDDWLNEVSGTQGIAGAADTLLFLKRGRCQNLGILRMTGRDVEESELAMTLDGIGWRLEGNAEDFNRTNEERAIITHLKEAGMQTPKEIGDALALNSSTARMRLMRMKNRGLIMEYGGKYWVKSEEV